MKSKLAKAAALLMFLSACATNSPNETTHSATTETTIGSEPTESTTMEASKGTLIDDRTAVFFDEDSERGIKADADTEAIQAVLQTVDTDPALSWAQGHHRILTGVEEPEGTRAIRVTFNCAEAPLTDLAQADQLFVEASNATGGGECFGEARIALDGTLLSFWVADDS